ncbi:MAG: RNA polymerase sigma factor, partial [Candidatus Eisenbacteria bacterium]
LECRQGNARAWEAIVRRHGDRMLNLAYQFTGDREEARDLAQEIFVRLYHKLDQYDPQRAFRTWLNSLARNLCIDHYRRRKMQPVTRAVPLDQILEISAPGEAADRRVEQRSEREFLLRAMDELGDTSREAIVLKDLQGHSIEEIAALLRVPIGTVKSRLFRARIELAQAVRRLQRVTSAVGGDSGL